MKIKDLRNFKMRHFVLILLLSVVGLTNAFAYDYEVDGIYYNLYTTTQKAVVTYATTSYNSYSGDVVIPSTVVKDNVTYTVYSIGGSAFRASTGLTSVAIPESVTEINNSAFYGCTGLVSVNIPNGVTIITQQSFYNCSALASVTIPSGVSSIGAQAFAGCTVLNTVIVKAKTPPTLSGSESLAFNHKTWGTNPPSHIYVPTDVVVTYKSAWTTYANYIEGFVIRHVDGYGAGHEDDSEHWCFIASPLSANTDPATVEGLTNGEFDLYRLNENGTLNEEWENYENNAYTDFVLVNGQGYLYANENDVDLMFFGDFCTDATKTVDLQYHSGSGIAGLNLVGNPFTVNAYSSRPYYQMNADGNGVIATAIAISSPIAPCIGVIVRVEENETSPTVTFSTTAPSTSNKGNINIEVSEKVNRSSNVIDNAIVSFNENDRLGKYTFYEGDAKVYIPQNGKEYAIVNSDQEGETSVNFQALKDGEYTLTFTANDVDMNYLHLIDNLTGTDIDLLTTPSYTFSAKDDDYASRFRLVYKTNGVNEVTTNNDFAFVSNGQIILNGQGNINIFDLAGRMVSSHHDVTSIATEGIAPGVYMLQLVNGDNVMSQKIVVK